MHNPRLAARYAKSLLDVSIAQQEIETTLGDIDNLLRLIAGNREFALLLRSPVVKADKKITIIDLIVADKVSPLTKAFIHLLVNKGREASLYDVALSFKMQVKELKRIKTVTLQSASPLQDSIKQTLRAKLSASMPEYTVELDEQINPDLIGGFILQIDDRRFDASVRRDLQDIRAQFTKNLYVQAIR